LASDAQSETVTLPLPNADSVPLFSRPVIVSVPEPSEREIGSVLDDLTLTTEKLSGDQVWRYISWLDTPLVAIGPERLGPSDLLVALAGIACEDHMLRLATVVDTMQYQRVNGLREERMINTCRKGLEGEGWTVQPRYVVREPPREIDVYATRAGFHLVLQLKSMLRPETPWEVYKRNEDIRIGIDQACDARRRFGPLAAGAVITDGYRGDYSTWRVAIDNKVPIGTLEDIPDLALDPHGAFELLRNRVGFGTKAPEGAPYDRSFELMGWTFRIVDSLPTPIK
jgi:hypothetical protein